MTGIYSDKIALLQQSDITLEDIMECDRQFNSTNSLSLMIGFKSRKWWINNGDKEYCLILRTWSTQADKPDYDTLRWLTHIEAYVLFKNGIYSSIKISKPKIIIKMDKGECI